MKRRLFLRAATSTVFLFATFDASTFEAFAAPLPVLAEAATPQAFSAEELDAIMAPIALYPDDLLAQTMMAATYPTDVVAAARWLKEGNNKSLKGEALEKAIKDKPWDPSVKSLAPFPQVLEPLDQHLDWTRKLGEAVSNQQTDVLASVQRLRAKAQDSGHLASNEQMKVTTEPAAAGATHETIVIEPAQPNTVYVPAYNPSVVYGGWGYATPPYYYPPPYGYYPGAALATGIAFGVGMAMVGGLWGWASPGWGGGSVNVNVNRYNNISGGNRWHGGANGSFRPNRPGGGRPGGVGGVGGAGRPGGVGGVGGAGRPGGPSQLPARGGSAAHAGQLPSRGASGAHHGGSYGARGAHSGAHSGARPGGGHSGSRAGGAHRGGGARGGGGRRR